MVFLILTLIRLEMSKNSNLTMTKELPSAICKNTHGSEKRSPFGCHDKIGRINFGGRHGTDLERHEIVDIRIDIG
jgi:hypothetical protein